MLNSSFPSPPLQLKQHATGAGRGGVDEDEDDEEMEDDEPYTGPRTLALTREEFKHPQNAPKAEHLASESQQRVPNEAT